MNWPAALYEGVAVEEHFNRSLKVYQKRPVNLTELLHDSVVVYPKKEALVCENIRLTFQQFQEKIDAVAYQLVHYYGVKKGDRIAVLFTNCLDYCISIFAVCQIGAIAVILNAKLQYPELEYMITDSGAKLLIMGENLWQNLGPALKGLASLESVLVSGVCPLPESVHSFDKLVNTPAPVRVTAEVSDNDIAFIMYTSGTTGRPKGATLTHLNIIHSCINYQRVMGLTNDDRTLITVPLFHVTGMVAQLILLLYVGGTSIILKEYKTDHFLESLSQEKASHTIVVPTIYVLMLMNEKSKLLDFSNFRIAAYGGAPMSETTISQLAERFPGLKMFNCYGATETASPATITPCEASISKSASVGLPVPVAEIKICDEDGNTLGPGDVGEVWIKGPMVIPGYWNNPQANEKEFTEGFWHSGDLGKMDSEGFVYVMDRKKDMINRGGEKIFSVEVENVLCSHPKIMEAAVVGVPDEVFGEQIKAVIVPKPEVEITAEEVQSFVGEKMAHYKIPKYVAFVTELPRNPGGKVLKKQLLEVS